MVRKRYSQTHDYSGEYHEEAYPIGKQEQAYHCNDDRENIEVITEVNNGN